MSTPASSDDPELRQTRIDLLKHFTTLNTGTIVIASTLFEKLDRAFYERRILVYAFFFLFMSLIFCIASLMQHEHVGKNHIYRAIFQLVGYLFMTGIGCLALFAFFNLRVM